MKHYVEITLLPNADITLYFLWEKLYQQIHLALVTIKDTEKKMNIGVSFPNYNERSHQLGCKLRLFAPSNEALETLDLPQWLSRLADYVHITSIRDVPKKLIGYAFFKRLQLKSNNARLARRKSRRKGINEEEAMTHFKDRKEKYSRAPFINVKSLSTEKRYRLMIVCERVNENQTTKDFSTYGLSAKSSVPLF